MSSVVSLPGLRMFVPFDDSSPQPSFVASGAGSVVTTQTGLPAPAFSAGGVSGGAVCFSGWGQEDYPADRYANPTPTFTYQTPAGSSPPFATFDATAGTISPFSVAYWVLPTAPRAFSAFGMDYGNGNEGGPGDIFLNDNEVGPRRVCDAVLV